MINQILRKHYIILGTSVLALATISTLGYQTLHFSKVKSASNDNPLQYIVTGPGQGETLEPLPPQAPDTTAPAPTGDTSTPATPASSDTSQVPATSVPAAPAPTETATPTKPPSGNTQQAPSEDTPPRPIPVANPNITH